LGLRGLNPGTAQRVPAGRTGFQEERDVPGAPGGLLAQCCDGLSRIVSGSTPHRQAIAAPAEDGDMAGNWWARLGLNQ
jgi:hypothetical protein